MATRLNKVDRFVDLVANECASAGVTLIFKDSVAINGNLLGWFSADSKELVVATQNDRWVSTLAHEYGHFLQMKDKVFLEETPYQQLEEWYVGQIELDAATVISHTRYVAACELDCEHRAVELLKQFRLLNAEERKDYIRRANAYVLMYEVARRQKRWYKSNVSALEDKNIYGLLPAKFITDLGRVPDDFEAAVLDNCY